MKDSLAKRETETERKKERHQYTIYDNHIKHQRTISLYYNVYTYVHTHIQFHMYILTHTLRLTGCSRPSIIPKNKIKTRAVDFDMVYLYQEREMPQNQRAKLWLIKMPTRLHIERTLKRITIAVTAIIYCIRRIVVVSGCIGAISGYNVNSENRIYSKSKFLPRKTHTHKRQCVDV